MSAHEPPLPTPHPDWEMTLHPIVRAARALLALPAGEGFHADERWRVKRMFARYELPGMEAVQLYRMATGHPDALARLGVAHADLSQPTGPCRLWPIPDASAKLVHLPAHLPHAGRSLYALATDEVPGGRASLTKLLSEIHDADWRARITAALVGRPVAPLAASETDAHAVTARHLTRLQDGWIGATFPWVETLVSAVQGIEGRRLDPVTRQWAVAPSHAPELVGALGGAAMVEMDDGARTVYDAEVGRRMALDEIRGRLTSELEVATHQALYPFQSVAVEFARVCHWRSLINDEPGCGKTGSSIACALRIREEQGRCKTLVVCPATLKLNWAIEIHRFAGAQATMWDGSGPHAPVHGDGEDFHIINYDVLHRHVPALHAEGFDLLILDECHRVRNPRAIRSRALYGDASEPERFPGLRTPYALGLSGTTVLNGAAEAFPMLHYLDPERFPTPKPFRTATTERQLTELHGRIRHITLRRKLADVWGQLPPKTEHDVVIELSAEARKAYEALLLAMFSAWGAKGRAGVVEVGRLQRFLTQQKMPRVIEMVDEIVAAGRSVLVFSVLLEPLRQLRAHYGANAAYLDGAMSGTARQAAVEAIQSGRAQVGCLSIRAAGEGITLTRADTVVFPNFDFVPAVHEQATARAHRMGQPGHVQAYYLSCARTIDVHLRAIREGKEDVASLVHDGVPPDRARAVQGFAELVERLRAEFPMEMRGIGRGHAHEIDDETTEDDAAAA